ncbi:lysophospholipid acyltransferase LPEAT1-like isoform X1 [Zingiber officinale]|uniref:lysophospholipid acyltransferase LPEAT1-like isoform X1 n=1 Tax=Zingiber officinale TaxID=94328 RepID=UPI001C4B2D45|nr:lysophospholipid acyltransferase LPEAT1-like isoform X1 [Zingiber officinale]
MASPGLTDLAGADGSESNSSLFPPGGEGDSATPKYDQPLLKPDSSPTAALASAAVPISSEELDRKYAPYVRRDAYGTMGREKLPLTEKILLGIAAVTLVPIRVVAGVLILVFYYLICRICTLFSPPSRENGQEDYAHMTGWRREVIVRCGRFASRAMLFAFGFYWIKESRRGLGNEVNEFERPGAIVSNHISYVDILYHMSSAFPSFVAKRSVASLPLVGLISKCLGCVYVQRESKSSDLKGVSGIVTERIQKSHKDYLCPMMLLFPEGTTTNGDFLLPFKSGAFLAKAPVVPVILRYPYHRFSPAWDSISGVRHVCLLLCQFVNHLEVIHLPVYYPSEQEKEDPKLYANNVRKLMATEGNLMLSDVGLAEKRIYLAILNALKKNARRKKSRWLFSPLHI